MTWRVSSWGPICNRPSITRAGKLETCPHEPNHHTAVARQGPSSVRAAMQTRRLDWWSPEMGDLEADLVAEVLKSNFLNDGDVTTRFEREVAQLLDSKHAVAVTSGTSALFLALAAAGVGHGDEVLVPDVTFIATANAVTLAGAKPVFVDVDPATLTVCPDAARSAITP